ncbi:casein kinase II, regulatory subunit [Globomyces pollinis-pini]|nr:casein kinase II, regulatory subunit [Globomyces pollinis-pini]KAJ2997189.1 casein kinase 2 regulatory subunit [Globomyces sp. JEL0801]
MSSEEDSESGTSWIDWFLSQRGNELFCAIDDDYILDRFNLAGLVSEVEHYQLAVDLITDCMDHELDENTWNIVDRSARHLYGLIHARWVLTNKGITRMAEKMKRKEFGKCPRVLCEDQSVIPVGLTDIAGLKGVKLYCPKCEDVYVPPSKKHSQIDGAFFTTSLPHLILQMFPSLMPQKTTERYIPRIFGFKVHHIANEHRRQQQIQESMNKKRDMMVEE